MAAQQGNTDIVKALLKSKADESERVADIDVKSFLNRPYGERTHIADNKEHQQRRWDSAKRFCEEHPDWI